MTSINDSERGTHALPRESRRQRVRRVVPLDPRRQRLAIQIGVVIVAAFLVAGGVLVYQASQGGKQITAYFTETIGVYPGSTVRVLGVPVGTVDAVRPAGSDVAVTMTLNHGVEVPADAQAVVVAPSVVADRYVQLTPAYTGGPQIASNAVIPVSRTAVPVEVDQIYAALNEFANELGPDGVNKHGALSNLIKTGASNLSGNGANLNSMITEYSGLSKTLGSGSSQLFGTISNLARFTGMLKANDSQVRLAEQQLAAVSAFLASDRTDLAAAMSTLAGALGQVSTFIQSNRSLLKSNVARLSAITSILVQERASLAEALNTVPLAADDVVNAYDGATGTLDGRADLNELCLGSAKVRAELGCANAAATSAAVAGTSASGPAGTVPLTSGEKANLPPLPLPTVGPVYGTPQAVLAGVHQ
jgi:phospholipid/cholesterol/gamma-HCH transport system substrate-binding protein